MLKFDLEKLKNTEIKKEWIIPGVSVFVAVLLTLVFALTAPKPEPPPEPRIVPIGKPRFAPGEVIYTDDLPKPKEAPKENQAIRPRS
jgi:hypothetical protein